MVSIGSASNARLLDIRVATGISERLVSSAVWCIWQGKNNDDIYIASRQIAGAVKCSLHSNRYCYVGFTKQFAQRLKAEGHHVPQSRAWVIWERPLTPEDRPLFVAEIWLVPAPLYTLARPAPEYTKLIKPPPVGKAAVVNIVYLRLPKVAPIIPPDVWELGYTRLRSDDYVAVFARLVDFDYDEFVRKRLPEIQANFQRRPQFLLDEKTALEAQALRIFLVNDPKIDGRLMILDAAVQWNPESAGLAQSTRPGGTASGEADP